MLSVVFCMLCIDVVCCRLFVVCYVLGVMYWLRFVFFTLILELASPPPKLEFYNDNGMFV